MIIAGKVDNIKQRLFGRDWNFAARPSTSTSRDERFSLRGRRPVRDALAPPRGRLGGLDGFRVVIGVVEDRRDVRDELPVGDALRHAIHRTLSER